MSYECRFNKDGNIKIGNMWSFNKLAGAGEIGGCKGTCSKYCTGCYNQENPKKSSCYVFNSYVRYGWDKSSVVKGHIRNTIALRKSVRKAFEDLHLQIKRAKKKPTAIRIHSSGEIETAEELIAWLEEASKWSEIPFYVYTKAYDILDEVLSTHEVPDNFYINISIWHEVGIECYNKWKHLNNVRAFVYKDDYTYPEELKINAMCPAYDAKGKMNHNFTCDKCTICFSKNAKVCGCYDH